LVAAAEFDHVEQFAAEQLFFADEFFRLAEVRQPPGDVGR